MAGRVLYAIGGPMRVGKSTLLELIKQRRPEVWTLPLDMIVEMLPREEMPRFYDRQKAVSFWRWFEPLLRLMGSGEHCGPWAVEGNVFFPEDVEAMRKAAGSAGCELRVVFLGRRFVTLDSLLLSPGRRAWIPELPPDKQAAVPERVMAASEEIKASCCELGLPYFDTAFALDLQLERAYAALMD
jgi:hypothetical protein